MSAKYGQATPLETILGYRISAPTPRRALALGRCDRNTHRCVGLGRFTGIRRAAVSREACVRVRVRVSWQSVGVVIAAGTRHRVAVAWCDED